MIEEKEAEKNGRRTVVWTSEKKKDGRKTAGYQDQHDTYVIKIMKNMITVNNPIYKYKRFLF